MAETVERLVVEIEAKIQKFKANMSKAGGQLDQVRTRFGKLGSVVGKVGSRVSKVAASFRKNVISMKGAIIGLVSGIVIKKIGGFINAIAAMGDEIGKTAQKLGLAPEALSELRFAAELTGVSVQQLQLGIQRMTRRIAEAAQGAGEAQGALKELGLSAAALTKLPVDEQFKVIADAMENVTSQSDKVRLGFKLFDSEGVNLIVTMKGGSKALRKMADEARRAGVIFTEEDVAAAAAFQDSINGLKFSLLGLGRTLTKDIMPVILASFDSLKETFIDARKDGKGFAESVGKFIKGLAFVTIIAVELMKTAWNGLKLIWFTAKAAFFGLQVAIGKGMAVILESFKTILVAIGPRFDDLFIGIVKSLKIFATAFVIGITTLFKNILGTIRKFAGETVNLLARVSAFPGIEKLTGAFNSIVFGADAAKKSIDGFAKTGIASIAGINDKLLTNASLVAKLNTSLSALNATNTRNAQSLSEAKNELTKIAAEQGTATDAFDRAKQKIIELNEQIDINKQKISEQAAATAIGAEKQGTALEATVNKWREVLGVSAKLATDFQKLAVGTFQQFASGIGDAFAGALLAGQKFKESMKDLMRSLAATIISSLVRIIVTAIVARVALSFFGVPSVDLAGAAAGALSATQGVIGTITAATGGATALQGGGIVTGPTLALIGEAGPEAIIPLDRAGGFGMGQQTIILEVDGEQLAQLVVPNMPDVLRAQFGATF